MWHSDIMLELTTCTLANRRPLSYEYVRGTAIGLWGNNFETTSERSANLEHPHHEKETLGSNMQLSCLVKSGDRPDRSCALIATEEAF